MHMGSSSLTRDQIRAPCIGSAESYLLHHQGRPLIAFIVPKGKNSSEKGGDDCKISGPPEMKPQLREASSDNNFRSTLCLVL